VSLSGVGRKWPAAFLVQEDQMFLKHLQSDHIDDIALSIHEDVYYGGFDEFQIKERLIAKIRESINYRYAASGMIPIEVVASLIQGVWEYEDRKFMDQLVRNVRAREEKEKEQERAAP
jgi:hypothetical protein